jgi:transcriptional regulator with XRE-family HTH domain
MSKKPPHRRPRPKPRYSVHYLRQWRERQRIDRKDLAEATGLAVQTVGRIENRLIQLTQETIDAFAKALKIPRGAIFDRPPPPPA